MSRRTGHSCIIEVPQAIIIIVKQLAYEASDNFLVNIPRSVVISAIEEDDCRIGMRTSKFIDDRAEEDRFALSQSMSFLFLLCKGERYLLREFRKSRMAGLSV